MYVCMYVRERIPVPHDNYLKSIISSRPHCKDYFCFVVPMTT